MHICRKILYTLSADSLRLRSRFRKLVRTLECVPFTFWSIETKNSHFNIWCNRLSFIYDVKSSLIFTLHYEILMWTSPSSQRNVSLKYCAWLAEVECQYWDFQSWPLSIDEQQLRSKSGQWPLLAQNAKYEWSWREQLRANLIESGH